MFSLIAKKDHKKFLLFNQNNKNSEDTSFKDTKEVKEVEESDSPEDKTKTTDIIVKNKLEPVTSIRKIVEDEGEELSEVNENKKSIVNSICMSRPDSRSMRVPTIDVQSLQEKLEKLEQSVAAMRKRRIGIVSGTKEFQRFLNELTPVC